MFKFVPLLAALLLALSTVGCSSFSELHYFKSETNAGGTPNYFRLSVQGVTLLSNSRYTSGYFDESVVDQYFNEIPQPSRGTIKPIGATKTDDTAKKEGEAGNSATASTGEEREPTLVMLLSSNSDDIANQLGALTQSEEFTNSIATLMGASRFEKAYESERSLANDRVRAKSLALTGDQLIAGLPSDAPHIVASGNALAFINAIAADLGAGPFADLSTAKTWLDSNRSRLVMENR